jgi:hypothetical protein
VRRNYALLRDDDREIVRRVRDFFSAAELPSTAGGIDVGSGPNLYPALAMLPWCEKITLWERAASNVSWLRKEVESYSSIWDDFWAVLEESPAYKACDARRELAAKTKIKSASIFGLPKAQWDIGTMFFVAESISSVRCEFTQAAHSFVGSLKPKAPFAAAFMAGSTSYPVGRCTYPAVSVDENDVRECLLDVAVDVDVNPIPTQMPMRDGYEGLLLALGRAGGQ